MLLDKLWVRIKGEFLSLREDVSVADDLKDKAELLLKKLEQRLGLANEDTDSAEKGRIRESSSERSVDGESLREIEIEWDELMGRKKPEEHPLEPGKPAKPNPRTLG